MRRIDENNLKNISIEFSNLVLKNVIEAPYVNGSLEFIKNNYKKYNFFIVDMYKIKI